LGLRQVKVWEVILLEILCKNFPFIIVEKRKKMLIRFHLLISVGARNDWNRLRRRKELFERREVLLGRMKLSIVYSEKLSLSVERRVAIVRDISSSKLRRQRQSIICSRGIYYKVGNKRYERISCKRYARKKYGCFLFYAKPSTRVSLIPAIREVSCPPSLNAASITLISVAVVSSPVKDAQSD